jgi:hypothetical protein
MTQLERRRSTRQEPSRFADTDGARGPLPRFAEGHAATVALAELLRGAHPRQDPVPDVAHRVAVLSGGLLYLFARMAREPRGGDGSVEQAVGVHMLATYIARFSFLYPESHNFTDFVDAMQQERRPDAKRARDEPAPAVTACSQLMRLANAGGQSISYPRCSALWQRGTTRLPGARWTALNAQPLPSSARGSRCLRVTKRPHFEGCSPVAPCRRCGRG